MVEVTDEIDVIMLTCATERLIVARVKGNAILLEVADDVEVAMFTCPAQRFVIPRSQISANFVESANRIYVATTCSVPSSPIKWAPDNLGKDLPHCIFALLKSVARHCAYQKLPQ